MHISLQNNMDCWWQ